MLFFCQAFVSMKDNVFARVCERWRQYLYFSSVQDISVSGFIPVIFSLYIPKIYYYVVFLDFFFKGCYFLARIFFNEKQCFSRVCERWLWYLCFSSVQDTSVLEFISLIFSSYIPKIYYYVVFLGFFKKKYVIFCQAFASMKNNVFAHVCASDDSSTCVFQMYKTLQFQGLFLWFFLLTSQRSITMLFF